jgi:hypothetical protein
MKRLIGRDIVPVQHEMFRNNRVKACEEDNVFDFDEAQKEYWRKHFKNYQFIIPKLTQKEFDDSECPIVIKMNKWVDDFVVDVWEIIKKDLMLNFKHHEDGNLSIDADTKKIEEFCMTYIQSEKDGKWDPMADLIHDYIHKHEEICIGKIMEQTKKVVALLDYNDVVVEEKVVPKSKSQLKKEKAREANKRRAQEKADKLKRQEKEAKYLEQKRKEAEKKRIAVCRAKNRK